MVGPCEGTGPRTAWYHRAIMAERLPELVGRAMIDPDFLAELQSAPEDVLARYELTEDERTAVRRAVARLAQTPAHRRAQELGTALLRRVAT